MQHLMSNWFRNLLGKTDTGLSPQPQTGTINEKRYASFPTIPDSREDLKRFSRPELFGHIEFDRKRR